MQIDNQGILSTSSLPQLGIIFPPADIRGIVDKTAQFVAKNGPEFEQRVLADQSNTQKFSFLLASNPYRAYYDAKVKEFQTGQGKHSIGLIYMVDCVVRTALSTRIELNFVLVESEATKQQIPEAIKQRQQRESEKKQKKEELLALTAPYSSQPGAVAGAVEKESHVLAIEDERQPEPPPEDQFSVGHPYATALDM